MIAENREKESNAGVANGFRCSMATAREKQLLEENRALKIALEKSQAENALLRQKVDLLIRKVFGASSEKIDPSQIDLFLVEPENAPGKTSASSALEEAEPSPSRRAATPRAHRWPQDLPVVEEVIDPAEVKEAPEQWRCIGSEISEQLDYEPGRFLRRRLVRRKYVSRLGVDAVPVIASLQPMLQQRSGVAPGLLAQIVVSKYVHHLPLYRQEQIYWRQNRVWLPRQNLAHWMELAADWLKPIYERIRTGVMGGGYVQVDESPVRFLMPGNGKAKTGYFWTASRPGGDVFYHWETSRAAACLGNVLPVDFKGTVQCDGYTGYPSFARHKEHIRLAGCWAHLRRKVYAARDQDPLMAGWLMRQIRHLYRIERPVAQKSKWSTASCRRSRSSGQTRLRPAPSRHQPAQDEAALPASQRHGAGPRLRAQPMAPARRLPR
jgi:transposase